MGEEDFYLLKRTATLVLQGNIKDCLRSVIRQGRLGPDEIQEMQAIGSLFKLLGLEWVHKD